MTEKHYMKRRFKCRCYEKDNTVKIYDNSEILFDVSYRDFDDAFYLSRKLQSVIGSLNELHEENEMRKEHQRTLEDKIRRLKDRVKTFEKHYSLNDIERLRGD